MDPVSQPRPTAAAWLYLLLAGWASLNLLLLILPITARHIAPHDWIIFAELPRHLENGTLFSGDPLYVWAWTPAAAWIMATVFVPLGYSFWLGLHVVSVAFLREWKLMALTLLSVPFWVDTVMGHMMVFVMVSGVMALRGSRAGAVVFIALTVLAPRPLQVPLLIWLLWQRPSTRVPFLLIGAAVVAHAVASGTAADWLMTAAGFTAGHDTNAGNLGPTRLFGMGWLIIGIPLSGWLTWKGHVGLAGIALSPYVLLQYWLVYLWEFAPKRIEVEQPLSQRVERVVPAHG
jgi:hypothetical protein